MVQPQYPPPGPKEPPESLPFNPSALNHDNRINQPPPPYMLPHSKETRHDNGMKRPYVSSSVELNGKNNTFSRKSIPQGPVGHFANAHTRKSGVDEGNDNQEMNRFAEFNGMQGHEHSGGWFIPSLTFILT